MRVPPNECWFGCSQQLQERLSGADLDKFFAAEQAFNAQYNAEVKTEHAFNGIGILDKVSDVVSGIPFFVPLTPSLSRNIEHDASCHEV